MFCTSPNVAIPHFGRKCYHMIKYCTLQRDLIYILFVCKLESISYFIFVRIGILITPLVLKIVSICVHAHSRTDMIYQRFVMEQRDRCEKIRNGIFLPFGTRHFLFASLILILVDHFVSVGVGA